MLYVFTGMDVEEARNSVFALVKGLQKKKAGSEYVRIEAGDDQDFVSYVGMQGLFGQKKIIFLDGMPDTKEFLSAVDDLIVSPNVFFLVEQKIEKKVLGVLKKKGVDIREYKKVSSGKQTNALFSIADALFKKDKEYVFSCFWELRSQGFSSEEILPIVGWQIKTLLLVWDASSAQAAGVSAYVYTKTKKGISLFQKDAVLQSFYVFSEMYGDVYIQKEKDMYVEQSLLSIIDVLYMK